MRKGLLRALIVLSCLPAAVPAFAYPTLQLDIAGGTYINETTVSSGDVFVLYALLNPNDTNQYNDTYYVSVALSPEPSTDGSYGSFMFNESPINVTGDMVYGTPPVDDAYPDIPSHGAFPTYYKEFSFTFNEDNKASLYDVQDVSGTHTGPTLNSSGTMYFNAFSIDTTLLQADYSIHFDLYNENIKSNNNKTDTDFAPFSHDAESCVNCTSVPEPSTLLLLGSGLLGLGLFGRRRKG